MDCSIVITTYGVPEWRDLAWSHAFPSAQAVAGAREVIVEHYDDLAIGPARNEAAKLATGEWLCFLDADDQLDRNYLHAMEQGLRRDRIRPPRRPHTRPRPGRRHVTEPEYRPDAPVVLVPAVSWTTSGGRKTPARLMPHLPLNSANYVVVGALVPRSLFETVGGFGDYPHGFEDWSLWAKCWKAGARFVDCRKAIYYATVNRDSKHRQGWRDREWQVATHMRVQAELFPEQANA